MADWSTIASAATATGTLVLAVATFSSVRSSQRSARVAERALLLGIRPVLVPSRLNDPPEQVMFGREQRWVTVNGGMAAVERDGDSFYFVLPLRNVGAGLGVLQGWYLQAGAPTTLTPGSGRPDPGVFRRQLRDLYVPAGDIGFWQGAVREADDVFRPGLREAVDCGEGLTLDLLYGDHEGGQSTVSRFVLVRTEGTNWQPQVVRHWTLEGHDPRD